MGRTRLALALASASLAACARVPVRPRTPYPIEYVRPTDASYQRWYERMREARVLEKLAGALTFIRLPVPLRLRLDECGESNAWYDEGEHVATFCYEWLEELARDPATGVDEAEIARDESVLGPVVFMYLHEVGHAVIDLLKLPVLGREEDAADQLATVILLRIDPRGPHGPLGAAARLFARSAETGSVEKSELADSHSLDGQRYYNLLCLAYGSDPDAYAEFAGEEQLPPDRAEECEREYHAVAHAVHKLLSSHLAAERRRE